MSLYEQGQCKHWESTYMCNHMCFMYLAAWLGACIRQGVVNGLIVCELCAYGPLLSKGRLAKGCFCGSNRLLKRIAFRWSTWFLHLLTHGHCCCTEACCLRSLPFCTESSSQALQAPGHKGRNVKGSEDGQALRVAGFGQRVVVLLRGQVTQQRREQGGMKGHAFGPSDRQGFFVQESGTHKVSPHARELREIAQAIASQVWVPPKPGMLVAFGEEVCRLVEVPVLLCNLTQDGQGTTDAAMIFAALRMGEGLACHHHRPLRLSSYQQALPKCVQNECARPEEDSLPAALPSQRQQALEHSLSLASPALAPPASQAKARQLQPQCALLLLDRPLNDRTDIANVL